MTLLRPTLHCCTSHPFLGCKHVPVHEHSTHTEVQSRVVRLNLVRVHAQKRIAIDVQLLKYIHSVYESVGCVPDDSSHVHGALHLVLAYSSRCESKHTEREKERERRTSTTSKISVSQKEPRRLSNAAASISRSSASHTDITASHHERTRAFDHQK